MSYQHSFTFSNSRGSKGGQGCWEQKNPQHYRMQIYNFDCLGKTKISPNFIASSGGEGEKKSNSLFLETIKTLLMLHEEKNEQRGKRKNLLAKNYSSFIKKERWKKSIALCKRRRESEAALQIKN